LATLLASICRLASALISLASTAKLFPADQPLANAALQDRLETRGRSRVGLLDGARTARRINGPRAGDNPES
jgi:hypothetical protein